jgi:hypothetical protein
MADLSKELIRTAPQFVWGLVAILLLSAVLSLFFLCAVGDLIPGKWYIVPTGNTVSGYLYVDVSVSYIGALAVAVLLMGILQSLSKDDALTPIRKKITGEWTIFLNEQRMQAPAVFSIERKYKKLALQIRWPATEKYEAFDTDIYDIAINPRIDPNTLMYYSALTLIRKNDKETEMRQFFTKLSILRNGNDVMMSGAWYDIGPNADGPPGGSIRFERKSSRKPSDDITPS